MKYTSYLLPIVNSPLSTYSVVEESKKGDLYPYQNNLFVSPDRSIWKKMNEKYELISYFNVLNVTDNSYNGKEDNIIERIRDELLNNNQLKDNKYIDEIIRHFEDDEDFHKNADYFFTPESISYQTYWMAGKVVWSKGLSFLLHRNVKEEIVKSKIKEALCKILSELSPYKDQFKNCSIENSFLSLLPLSSLKWFESYFDADLLGMGFNTFFKENEEKVGNIFELDVDPTPRRKKLFNEKRRRVNFFVEKRIEKERNLSEADVSSKKELVVNVEVNKSFSKLFGYKKGDVFNANAITEYPVLEYKNEKGNYSPLKWEDWKYMNWQMNRKQNADEVARLTAFSGWQSFVHDFKKDGLDDDGYREVYSNTGGKEYPILQNVMLKIPEDASNLMKSGLLFNQKVIENGFVHAFSLEADKKSGFRYEKAFPYDDILRGRSYRSWYITMLENRLLRIAKKRREWQTKYKIAKVREKMIGLPTVIAENKFSLPSNIDIQKYINSFNPYLVSAKWSYGNKNLKSVPLISYKNAVSDFGIDSAQNSSKELEDLDNGKSYSSLLSYFDSKIVYLLLFQMFEMLINSLLVAIIFSILVAFLLNLLILSRSRRKFDKNGRLLVKLGYSPFFIKKIWFFSYGFILLINVGVSISLSFLLAILLGQTMGLIAISFIPLNLVLLFFYLLLINLFFIFSVSVISFERIYKYGKKIKGWLVNNLLKKKI